MHITNNGEHSDFFEQKYCMILLTVSTDIRLLCDKEKRHHSQGDTKMVMKTRFLKLFCIGMTMSMENNR